METMQPNAFRYRPSSKGHYESYFLRANHPSRPLALWVRYTMFHAKGAAEADGELWCMWFDGEKNRIETAYRALPFNQCRFATDAFAIAVGDATVDDRALQGK